MSGPIRSIIHNFAHRHDAPCNAQPMNSFSPAGPMAPPVEMPQPVVYTPCALNVPTIPIKNESLDESNKLGVSAIRVASTSGRWQKVGLEVDLPLSERPTFLFEGKPSDGANERIQSGPLDGSYTVENNHIRVERSLSEDGKRARYTIFFHESGRGVWDTNIGRYDDGPLSGAGSEKNLIITTSDGTRHLLKVRGEELQNSSKPVIIPEVPKRETIPPVVEKVPSPPPPTEKREGTDSGNAVVDKPVPKPVPALKKPEVNPPAPTRDPWLLDFTVAPTSSNTPPSDGSTDTKTATPTQGGVAPLPPEVPLLPTVPPPVAADPVAGTGGPPPAVTPNSDKPGTSPEVKANPLEPPVAQSPAQPDFAGKGAERFIRSQFAELDITTFDSDEKRNVLKAITSIDTLALPAQDVTRIESMLEKTKLKTLPVGTVLEHRVGETKHRMVIRKFSEDIYVLDTVDTFKSEKGEGEGMKADSTAFIRGKDGKWFAMSGSRLLSTYLLGACASPGLTDALRIRLAWLGYGAEEVKGHSLKPYVPQRPTETYLLAPRSKEDPAINKVPTHGIPFAPVTAETQGIADQLLQRVEWVMAQVEQKLPKVGGHTHFEQSWAHGISVEKLDENLFAIGTHTQVTVPSGTAHTYDVMLMRRGKDGKSWEVAQLEFNGTDFVAVAQPDRYLAKDEKYDRRFSMLEKGLKAKK